MGYPGTNQENKRHGLSYSAKKVQKLAHDVIDQLDIAINALRDIKENGMGVTKATDALERIEAIDRSECSSKAVEEQ